MLKRRAAGYGVFGGYDIMLAELNKPVDANKFKPICLPGPRFDDLRVSTVIGFGNYHRNKKNGVDCLTTKHGPMKDHKCAGHNVDEACQIKKPVPSSPLCKQFFKKTKKIENKTMDLFDDIIILNEANETEICYQDKAMTGANRGWCKVSKSYYEPWHSKKNKPELGWGYCSRECFLEEENSGKRRIKEGVDVLDDKLCQQYLNQTLEGQAKVWPQILCAGKLIKWNYQIWTQDGNKFKEADYATQSTLFGARHPINPDPGPMGDLGGYIKSPGTCNGDSGGPLIFKENSTHVVIGIISGGRSLIGS